MKRVQIDVTSIISNTIDDGDVNKDQINAATSKLFKNFKKFRIIFGTSKRKI
jgi:hypothetical protein